MPTEITTGGVQKLSGFPNAVSAQKTLQANVAEAEIVRQELPSGLLQKPVLKGLEESVAASDHIEKNIENLNTQIQNIQRDLQFSVDADSGRTIIRVIDSETRETIRIIPPEDMSVIAQRLEGHSGILFSSSV